jgi:hypothetical protein
MLALDHTLNFIEHLDCMFIIGDKQAVQACLEFINAPLPRAGFKGSVPSNFIYEIVNNVSFFLRHARL